MLLEAATLLPELLFVVLPVAGGTTTSCCDVPVLPFLEEETAAGASSEESGTEEETATEEEAFTGVRSAARTVAICATHIITASSATATPAINLCTLLIDFMIFLLYMRE